MMETDHLEINNNTDNSQNNNSQHRQLDLLQKVQAMMQVESALTATLEKVEPWLTESVYASNNRAPSHCPRVRPVPTNAEQVKQVLAVARSLAARTSAPAGWNPQAPVMGFSTPSPLPHQLRGGALAALQLERARQAERDKKRQRIEQQQQQQQQQQKEQEASKKAMMTMQSESDIDRGSERDSSSARDPKRRDIAAHEKDLNRSQSDLARSDAEREAHHQHRRLQQQQQQQQQQAAAQAAQQDVSMNLSDSSSSSSDDED